MSNSILIGLNLDHSIFLGSLNLFLDEHPCHRNVSVPRPLDFLYEFLVWSVNQTTSNYTTHEHDIDNGSHLNYIFAFRVVNLDLESAMLSRFRKARISLE